MKIEKVNFTILCLTVITLVSLCTGYAGLSIVLWIGYGFYKSTND